MKRLKQKIDMMKMNLTELSTIFQKILDKLRTENYQEIEFTNDLYRIIPTEKWSSFGELEIDNCSLFDDVENLKELASNENRRCTYVDFDRIASVLREISQNNNPVRPSP